MPTRVPELGVIAINGRRYYTKGPVTWLSASTPPPKIALGDYTEESNPQASTVYQDDLSGGIGVEIHDTRRPEHMFRCWDATANLRHPGQVILPSRATATAQAADSDCEAIADYRDEIYKCHGTTVYKYDAYNDVNTSSRTLLNSVKDWARGLVGTTDTLVLATGSEVDYLQTATWARNTTDIDYVVFLDELLWGIDATTGQLYYTDDLSAAWISDAVLQLPPDYAVGLVAAPGPDDKHHIYVKTRVGVYWHDDEHKRLLPTGFAELPYHPKGGEGGVVWRGAIAYPAGMGINMVGLSGRSPVGEADVPMGPDRDHGVATAQRGVIIAMASSHNELFAAVDATTGAGWWEVDFYRQMSQGMGSSTFGEFGAAKGYSNILGWSEAAWRRHGLSGGWQVVWRSASTDKPIKALAVSNAYGAYNLWWSANHNVYRMPLPSDVVNPLKVTGSEYASSAVIEFFWFTAGVPNQQKLALSQVVETTNPSSSETVKVEYALNWNEETADWTTLGTVTSSGETRYYFGATRQGVAYRAIKFRLTLARGASFTSTPVLRLYGLAYRKRIRLLYGIRVEIDGSRVSPDGRSPIQQATDLRSDSNSTTLIEHVWRDDTSNAQNYYMEPLAPVWQESTGRDHAFAVLWSAVEPEQTTSR